MASASKIKIFNKIFYYFFVFLLSYNSYSADEYKAERNWRKSLNIEIKGYNNSTIRTDEWIKTTKQYISEGYRDATIQGYMAEPIYMCNTAIAQFKLFYQVEGEDTIYAVTLESTQGRIAVSGQKKFKDDILQDAKDKILTGRSYPLSQNVVSQSSVENGVRCDDIKGRINKILGSPIVREGGHSEGYLVLELHRAFPRILTHCASQHNTSKIKIIGTIFALSSLKDPCQSKSKGTCFHMLDHFNHHLPTLLNSIINSNNLFSNKILPIHQLESVVLIAGKNAQLENDLSTRSIDFRNHNLFNEKIIMDFDHPQARIFSTTFDDIE